MSAGPAGGGNWSPIGNFPFGSITWNMGAGDWLFAASGCYHYGSPATPGATCIADSNGCVTCGGTYNITLYATMGSFSGHVTQLPDNKSAAGVTVSALSTACGGLHYRTTDANGDYTFNPTSGAGSIYNYGVGVDNNGNSPGTRDYLLTADACEDGVPATALSSTMIPVNLIKKAPYAEDPGIRPPPAPPSPPPTPTPPCQPPDPNVGKPVNVVTGNMWLDHTDADVAALGGGIRLTRSYNSVSGVSI